MSAVSARFPTLPAMRHWWCILIGCACVEGACFQNAKQDLKKLWNRKTGETYPIGVWLTSDYPAARLSSKLIQIVAEESILSFWRRCVEICCLQLKTIPTSCGLSPLSHQLNRRNLDTPGRRNWGTVPL